MRKEDPYFSRAVEKAMLALEYVRQNPEPLALTEITTKLGLSKASAFRLLYTLEALHYLAKTPDGRYFGPRRTQYEELVQQASEPLERLSMEFRETASLAALCENHVEVLALCESPQLMRMGNTTGRILPPNASSLGKAITAFQDPETVERLVRSYGIHSFTPNTITDEIALREEFTQIRERGYAEDMEESISGGRCFAAPILRANGHAIAAVSLSMPLLRFHGEAQRQAILTAVRDTARTIGQRLAWS